MGMKLSVYLLRTEQKLEEWVADNDINSIDDFAPRCAFRGLVPDAADVVAVRAIIESRRLAETQHNVEQSIIVEKPKKKKRVDIFDADE
jgi:hypothetical protein